MHGYRQEEDGVAVVGPGTGAEVLLHGLHDGEELVGEIRHVVEHHLHPEGMNTMKTNPKCFKITGTHFVLQTEFTTYCFSHIEM